MRVPAIRATGNHSPAPLRRLLEDTTMPAMRKKMLLVFRAVAAVLASYASVGTQAAKTLDIYFIDVEGGQSTLFVSPSGESMLVDAGNPGDRDADRIAAVAKQAGIRQIDVMLTTHFDGDHHGGVK